MGAVDTAFVQQYTDTLRLLVQQKGSKLRDTVMVDTDFTGEYKFYDQLDADSMTEKVSRNQDTPTDTADHKRRRISKRDFIHNKLLDKEDQLNMLIDPKSMYMQSAALAAGRTIDDRIIAAYDGTAYAGKAGGTETSFTSGNIVAVGSATTGMTKQKLLDAKLILDNNDVEEEDRFAVIRPKQLSDLLNTTEVASSDFNTVKALVQGELKTWLGFEFRITTRLVNNDSDYRKTFVYHRAAMQLAIQKEPTGRIDERADKNYATQCFFSMSIGATRLEEKRIAEIVCSES
jgi:hypothetical protein